MITRNLTQDASSKQIQVPGSFVTQDGTTIPKASPLTVSSSIITIVPPANSVEFIVYPSAALRISDVADMSTYDLVATSTKESIPCAGLSAIYLIRDSSDVTLSFRFNTV